MIALSSGNFSGLGRENDMDKKKVPDDFPGKVNFPAASGGLGKGKLG